MIDSIPRRTFPALTVAIAICVLALLPGCNRGIREQTDYMTEVGDVSVSSRDVRARGYEFAIRFTSIVQIAADSIAASTEDPHIRRNSIVWKLGATTAMQQSIFQPDPLASLLDAWTLVIQMREYLETGGGRDMFVELQPIAIHAARKLENQAAAIAGGLGSPEDIASIQEHVMVWAREHPLTNPAFLREETIPRWKQVDELSKGVAAVASMEVTIQDMTDRLNAYSVLLPRQARWEVELVLMEYLTTGEMQSFLDNMDQITLAADDVADFTDSIDRLIAKERDVALEAVRSERVAVMDELSTHLAATLQFLHKERLETMAQLDSLSAHTLAGASPEMRDLVDHFFWRAAQLLAGLVAVCAIGAVIFLRALGSRA